ncbi:MAG: hypothetical protein KTR25_05425 [Myxococcales bacterium]|nr:hypothetical protein [Myxococcales bacterium]
MKRSDDEASVSGGTRRRRDFSWSGRSRKDRPIDACRARSTGCWVLVVENCFGVAWLYNM